MSSKALSFWIRCSVIALAVCGLFVCTFVLPQWMLSLTVSMPEYEPLAYAWIVFLCIIALPCFAILPFIWKVSSSIKEEKVFTLQTSNRIKTGALILLADVAGLFLGTIIFAFIAGETFIAIVFASMFMVAAGLIIALFAAVLSRYVAKAAILQEEVEGTI